MWDNKRLKMIEKKEWLDCKDMSGKLSNPKKTFYLKLAAEACDVSNELYMDGICCARKEMMGCGMARKLIADGKGSSFSHTHRT